MEEQIKKLEERRAALVKQSNESKDVAELKSINQQLMTINDDIAALRDIQAKQTTAANQDKDSDLDERTKAIKEYEKQKELAKDLSGETRSDAPPKYIPGKGFIPADESRNNNLDSVLEEREKAGQDLKEKRAVKSPLSTFGELRAVTVTPAAGQSATIVVPSTFSSKINPDFPVVSSLIDAVSHLSLNGGDSFRQPYITGIDTANYTTEGADAAEAETSFDYVDINRTKITAYAEISKELEKLPSAPYADVVFQNIRTSMRQLLTKEILVGAGGTNQIVGIFSAATKAIDANTDLSLSQITDTTLDEIVFNYGGSEEVEDPAVLILNKIDLLAFSKVRTSTKQKFYDIRISGNSGAINGVPFIINSACKALTAPSGTNAGDYCMAYGSLSNYQLVEFSQMEVERSDDFKFRKGMRAFRGEVHVGGNCVRKNGFLRIKKIAA